MAKRIKTASRHDDRARYLWLLDQFKSAAIATDGTKLFDMHLALPPAKTIEESIDLARRPFTGGDAVTSCRVWLNKKKTKSKFVLTACEPIAIEGGETLKFGLHLEPGNRFRWHVTEFSTGSTVSSQCPSREAALAKARERVGKYRSPHFLKSVESYRDSIQASAAAEPAKK